jgi:hypothetical protein
MLGIFGGGGMTACRALPMGRSCGLPTRALLLQRDPACRQNCGGPRDNIVHGGYRGITSDVFGIRFPKETNGPVANPLSKCHSEATGAKFQCRTEQGPEFGSEKGGAAGDKTCTEAEAIVCRCDRRLAPCARWFRCRVAIRSSSRSMPLDNL